MPPKDIKAVIANIDTGYSEYEWDGLSICVRPLISIEESIELVDTVMQSCINPKGNVFMPELMDLMFRVNVICFYTDVEIPETLQDQCVLVYGTNLYDDVIAVVSDGQITSMQKCLELFATRLAHGSEKFLEADNGTKAGN